MNWENKCLRIIAIFFLMTHALPQICHGEQDVDFKKLQSFLSESRQQLNRAPHWVDLYRFANANGIDLFKSIKPEQTGQIVDEMKAAHQDLPIKKEELFSILKAQRQAILTWKCEAHIRRIYGNASTMPRLPLEERRRFMTADGRFLMEGDSINKNENNSDYYLMTFSDGIQRTVRGKSKSRIGGKPTQPASIESIQQDPTLNFYFQPGNIIADAMVVDSDRAASSRQFAAVDIMYQEPLSFVLEGKHDINGSQCVCLMTPIATYYFDIEHGFALCRREQLPKPHVTEVEYIVEASNFAGYQDGIWLPSKVRKTWYSTKDSSVIELSEEVDYSDVSLNKPVPIEEFTDVIPAGALVTDYIKNISYISGEKGEISALVSDAVPSGPKPLRKSRSLFWLVIANLLVAALVLAWLYYPKLKSRHP